ncbi:MAG: HAD hydrolase-like protein [Sulfolobales archaeon]
MVKVVTFDLYGTLVDWRSSIGALIRYVVGSQYIEDFFQCDLNSVKSLASYKPYSEILAYCFKKVCEEALKPWRDYYAEAIAISFAKSPPFPDTILGLKIIKSMGLATAIISNTEKRLVKITISGMEHLIDRIITAEDIGVYKPSREAFTRAYRLLGIGFDEAVHVSSYPQYDLEPARSLGIKAIHLNRYGYIWEPSIDSLEKIIDLLKH